MPWQRDALELPPPDPKEKRVARGRPEPVIQCGPIANQNSPLGSCCNRLNERIGVPREWVIEGDSRPALPGGSGDE